MNKKIERIYYCLIYALFFVGMTYAGNLEAATVIDHTSVQKFENIPSEWINQAKSNLRIGYQHTSHGSQIVTGMGMLSSENGLYSYTTGSDGFLCDYCMQAYGAYDLGNPNYTAWVTATRSYLNGSGNDRNVIMWSWCGEVSSATELIISGSYLANMNQLEQEYPDVKFVYMTGHLDGTGEAGNLKIRNQQIRDYAIANNKILFDFADIESYDPDGTYYPNESDACSWCTTWCESHTCPDCSGSCAHSHCFNCYNKGKAFWYMMAVLAGWDEGVSPGTTPDVPTIQNVTVGDGTLSLTWIASDGASAYNVYYSTSNNSSTAVQQGGDIAVTNYSITGLTNGTRYYVWVKAKNSAGVSDFSVSVSGTPVAALTAPDAPTIQTLTAGDGTLSLTWTASDRASAYEVFYSMTNNATTPSPSSIGEIIGTNADIFSLANGTRYYVWVKAINSAGDSDFSASTSGTPVAALTVPNAPAIQTVTAGEGTLSLIWTASAGSSAYGVWYATTDNSSAATQRGGDITDTSYSITGLTNGTRYYVWVKAKNSAGYSTFSASANGTPVASVTNNDEGGGGGGCFIATAAYGSPYESHVKVLREFRDSCLMQTGLGRAFVNFYYEYSPVLADVIAKHGTLRMMVRWGLAPVVGVAYVAINTSMVEKVGIVVVMVGMLVVCCFVVRRGRMSEVSGQWSVVKKEKG
jgi:hypothetical protein